MICDSGVLNFLKCRIPVQTQLKPEIWAHKFKKVYGFPLDFDRSSILTSIFENHASAQEHTQHIDQYVGEELKYGVLYGPYESLPFYVHILPLMTREKQNLIKDVQ